MKKIGIALILIVIVSGILVITKTNKIDTPLQQEKQEKINNEANENIEEKTELTPLSIHGRLNLKGTKLVDKNEDVVTLKGISTHGLQWYPQYVNKEAFEYMRDEWGINVVRLAMYTDPNVGYTTETHTKVKEGINYATELGLYVIVDWHILSDGNPNKYKKQAIEFFKEIATEYKDNENIIYEICNEPNGNVTWEKDVKPYAEEVIGEIRKIDSKAIIICGTPTWCQDVDKVAKNRIEGYENIMYALHFYAATHTEWLRDRTQKALDAGLPIFVSEFGICDASGNGAINYKQAEEWMKFLNDNDISMVIWNLSNKRETSAVISSKSEKVTDWNEEDLSEAGKWFVEMLKK